MLPNYKTLRDKWHRTTALLLRDTTTSLILWEFTLLPFFCRSFSLLEKFETRDLVGFLLGFMHFSEINWHQGFYCGNHRESEVLIWWCWLVSMCYVDCMRYIQKVNFCSILHCMCSTYYHYHKTIIKSGLKYFDICIFTRLFQRWFTSYFFQDFSKAPNQFSCSKVSDSYIMLQKFVDNIHILST